MSAGGSENHLSIIYFDLESTALGPWSSIVQIAAKIGEQDFNIFVNPIQDVSFDSRMITGFDKINGVLYRRGKEVPTKSIYEALRCFERFIMTFSTTRKCLLVAHNASFDASLLLREAEDCGLINIFNEIIFGFANTLPLFRAVLPERQGQGKFKLETLANDFLKPDKSLNFHDAMYDVKVLETLVKVFNSEKNLSTFTKTFEEYYKDLQKLRKIKSNLPFLNKLRDVLSLNMRKRLAAEDILYHSIVNTYKSQGEEGIIHLFTENVNDKPRITNDKKVLNKLINFCRFNYY